MAKITEAQVQVLKGKWTDEQLTEIAEKFGKIPTSYSKKDDIITAGLLTEEEFEALPIVPRSTAMQSATQWPKIGGRKVYPLSGALNYEETTMYYEYKKGHKPAAAGTSSRTLTEEQKKDIEEIRKVLADNKELLAKFEALLPKKKNTLLEQMLGVSDVALLKGKVNMTYVMFRGPNGEFAEELQPKNIGKLFEAGFEQKYRKAEVLKNIEALKEKGVNIEGCIVDLK